MSEWRTYALEDICKVGSSKRIHLADYVETGIPFYRGKEITELSTGKKISEPLFISNSKFEEIQSKFPIPKINDILITAVGTIGEIYRVQQVPFYFKDGNIIWLRDIRIDIINVDYLYYFLKSNTFQKMISLNNIGAVQKALTIDYVKTVKLELPSLDVQRKIVQILKALDSKIALNNAINENLEAMAKTLYDYWFVQFDFPDEKGQPYKSSGGKMVYNDQLKREIPEGWGVEKLGEIANFVTEKRLVSDEDIDNYIGTENMLPDMKGVTGAQYLPVGTSATVYHFGDILISNIRPYFKKIWLSNKSGCSSSDVLCVRPSLSINSEFLYATLARNDFFNYTVAGAKGSKMPRGDKKHIMNYQVPLYDELVEEFSERVKSIYSTIQQNSQQNQELAKLRDWLLPMLMNGQVRVG